MSSRSIGGEGETSLTSWGFSHSSVGTLCAELLLVLKDMLWGPWQTHHLKSQPASEVWKVLLSGSSIVRLQPSHPPGEDPTFQLAGHPSSISREAL